MKHHNIQHYVTRVASFSRAARPKEAELAEARQDLQEARLERDIMNALRPKEPYVRLAENRRARLARLLYPEGKSK